MPVDNEPATHAPMPGAEGLVEPLRSRWSPTVFDPDHRLTTEQITTLLHAGQWAPSSGNVQPWRFVVAERGSVAHRALVPHLTPGNSGWVPRASVVFLAGLDVDPDEDPEGKAGEVVGLYGLGQAAAHLTFQAQSMGLWTHQFGGFDKTAVARALAVPPPSRFVAGIAVGVRGDATEGSEREREKEQKVRRRKPLAEIAYGDSWGEPWPPTTS